MTENAATLRCSMPAADSSSAWRHARETPWTSSDMTLTTVLRRMHGPVTVRSFRSTTRQWMANFTDASHDEAEVCLARTPLNVTNRSY